MIAERPSLEQVVAMDLASLTRDAPIGSSLTFAPSSRLCSALERYLPELLERADRRWGAERFDGIFMVHAQKIADRAVRAFGTAVLISDQTITPVSMELTVTDDGLSIGEYRVRVGEPGGGSLGISGPPCNSGAAARLASRLAQRLELGQVSWMYETESRPSASSDSMRASFELVESFAVSSGEVWADLHNDFDFDGVEVGWLDRTVTLAWRRASGTWVPAEAPRALRMVFSNVTFLLMNLGRAEGDPRTVDAVGYIRCDAPATEQGFLPDRRDETDHMVFMWDNGGYLRIFAGDATLEVVPDRPGRTAR